MSEYYADLKQIQQLLENQQAVLLPPFKPHTHTDREDLCEDPQLLLRRFIDGKSDAVSIFSEKTERPSISIQVSSYLDSLYGTEQTYFTVTANITTERCTQDFILGVPSKKIISLHVSLADTALATKDRFRVLKDLPDANFQLMHCGRVLDKISNTLEKYNVHHDSTLRLLSSRPDEYYLGACSKTYLYQF